MFAEREKISLYSEKLPGSCEKRNNYILYPFWGPDPETEEDLQKGKYDNFVRSGNQWFEMTDLSGRGLCGHAVPLGMHSEQ